MEEPALYSMLPQRLLPWFAVTARDLPWRKDREPYHVWLSEIMLQQTRVEAVKGYYTRFLQALPTIEALAAAPYEQVQKLWEGLGYYSRARNLQKAAQQIVAQGGAFPHAYDEILALPGVGTYTAGAIASICFEQPRPAVDGNVLRICARIMASEACVDEPGVKSEVAAQLAEVYPPGSCGAFTQSLMELGATVCLPNGAPDCTVCPVADLCRARQQGKIQDLPVRAKKRSRREEEMTVFLLRSGGRIALCRRQNKGLLAGLWEFPHVPGHLSAEAALDAVRAFGCEPRELELEREKQHIFTHVLWRMRSFDMQVAEPGGNFVWVTEEELRERYALPTAFRQFLTL